MCKSAQTDKIRSPLKAIRVFCIECQGDSFHAVVECRDTACQFYAYRKGAPPARQPHKPMKAIKTHCFDNCQAGTGYQEVLHCRGDTAFAGSCPVFPFRLGVNPNVTPATREKRRQRALLRDPLGIQSGKDAQHQSRVSPPESTKMDQAIVYPGLHEPNEKIARKCALEVSYE